jgi:hypothetical protein
VLNFREVMTSPRQSWAGHDRGPTRVTAATAPLLVPTA